MTHTRSRFLSTAQPAALPKFGLLLGLALALIAGCGDDAPLARDGGMNLGDAGADAAPDGQVIEQNTTIEEVLTDFGVDIAASNRVDVDGESLPDDYAPLGSSVTLNRFAEIQLFGVALTGDFSSTSPQPVFDLVPDADNRLVPTLINDESAGDETWFTNRQLPRHAVSADFDGDGLEEVAIAYQILNEPVTLQFQDDMEAGFQVSEPQVVATGRVGEIVLLAGDFDGDVDEDLLIAIQSEAGIEVSFWANTDGRMQPTELAITLPVLAADPTDVHLILEAGNIDRDKSIEVAAMINEPGETWTSRYFLFDDAGTEFLELDSGPTTVVLPTETRTARSGDIKLGDVDGDGMDEVVFGGLTEVGNTCGATMFSVVQVLDDARNDLAPLAAHQAAFFDRQFPCSSGAQHIVTYHPITLPDVDGDRVAEIHAFERVFDDLAASPGTLTELYQIPQESLLMPRTTGAQLRYNANTVSFSVGDVTSDGRENIVFYSGAAPIRDQGLHILGLDMIEGFSEMQFFETEIASQSNPFGAQVLLADVDLDQDTASLSYSEGSYQLVFTEPIILAALAAPPCARDAGPSVDDACRTAFGKAVTDTMERTDSWSLIAGVSVGFEAAFSTLGVQVGAAEVILNTRSEARFYSGEAYSLTNQVVRETGVLEDSVIFTTVPFDVYTYQILSHPNPELVGSEVQVRMPRSPITIMATREFYNANIDESGTPIDARIFEHTEGEPSTYPTPSAKDALLRRYTGVESDQVDVGQGSGFTEVSIREFTETSSGREFSFEATVDFRATNLTVVGGVSLGGGAGSDIVTRQGEETIYQGTVGNVAAENFPQDAISFGLFAYIVDDTANPHPFEVVNYWVVPSTP